MDNEVVGAVKAVAPHPTDPDTVYVGTVNGGVWRTTNATSARPTWNQLTDAQLSLSIGALELDPTDLTHATLVAGTGRFSSMNRAGGSLIGVLRTTDSGVTWTTHNAGGMFTAFHICDVVPRGNTIVVATNNAGIFRTTNAGATWAQVSGAAGTGLPAGVSFALAGDPTLMRATHLYAHSGIAGIFRSTDTGGTWVRVSNAAMDALIGSSVNVKISVGVKANVYVAIAGTAGQLTGLFRSADGGANWTALDLPQTVESGVSVGLHPGGQAGIHMSLAADRQIDTLVYIGGDRQPGGFPNAVGARDFSGRLFRVDAARAAGSQATHITHSNTTTGTAPHADSRCLAIDAQADLLEGDDGGIYRRRIPRSNAADWVSVIGDLQVTELHSAAWDANTGTAVGGAQDTGSPQQQAPGGARWPSISTGDGGVVVVDDTPNPASTSVRYSSFQRLAGLRREVYDAAGILQSRTPVPRAVLGGGAVLQPQFYTPLELNQVSPGRLIIGAGNGVYESDDQGDTVRAIAPGIVINSVPAAPIAYGVLGNLHMLYVGSGTSVLVRTSQHPKPLTAAAGYPGTLPVQGIAAPPTQPFMAFVIDNSAVFRTRDAGATWTTVTGNLLALGGVILRSVAFCEHLNGGSIVVGTNAGAFAASIFASPVLSWTALGSGMPTAPILRLRYSPANRVLLAATLGRGAWTLDIP